MAKELLRVPINKLDSETNEFLISKFGQYLKEELDSESNCNLIIEKETNPQILYHHTSLEVLFAILENISTETINDSTNYITLRGTDITFLNDISEFDILPRLLEMAIKDIEKNIEDSKNKNIADLLNSEYLKNIANLFELFSIHVISFSENPDNLPMWNTYGCDGKGVAIGLDFLELKDSLIQINLDRPNLIKCSYNKEKFNELNIKLANEIYTMFSNKNGKLSLHTDLSFDGLAEYFSMLKNNAFDYENEWRLVKLASYCGGDQKKFNLKNGILKPYIELMIPLNVLKKIRIGPCPCSKVEVVMKSIELGLEKVRSKISKRDLSIEVIPSSIPYRLI